MAMIFFLKMLCDLSLYYMFTSPIAGYFGGGQLMACMILQCVIYALSRLVKNRFLRFVTLIPLGLCFILRLSSLADTIALIPTTLFILWQSLADRPQPDISRQRQWLEECLKVLVFVAAVGLIAKDLAAVIPWVASWLLSNIALLRTLRHEPAVQNTLRFQAMNLALVGAVPAIAGCLGSKQVVSAIFTPLSIFYRQILVPLLTLLLWVPFMILQWFFDLLFPDYVQRQEETEKEIGLGLGDYMEQVDFQIPLWLKVLFWVTLASVAVIVLYFLVRMLLTPRQNASDSKQADSQSSAFVDTKSRKRSPESGSVQRIRRQYRKFLKLCGEQGVVRTESTTSRDIDRRAQRNIHLSPVSPKIRQLYIKARYAGRADHTAVKEMTQLCAEAKRSTKP